MLVCLDCGIDSEHGAFVRDVAYSSGFKNLCKPCSNCRNRIWKIAHPEKTKESRHKQKTNQKIWSETNQEKCREARERWKRNHPDRAKFMRKFVNHRRRATIKEGEGYTEREWQDLCLLYNNVCVACYRTDLPLTIDHIVPLKLGGLNTISNSQPLCKPCNSKKHTKVLNYRYWYGFVSS